jgi:mannose-6-phosphate isomerase-like protein (cupin superfamily)
MKKLKYFSSFLAGVIVSFALLAFTGDLPLEKYILVHEKDIAKEQPGPHKGGGITISYPFFEGTEDFKMAFRKRILKPGSSIGYHLQETDEIYYILSGQGEMQMNGKTFPVTTGDAVLTRPGSSHGIKPATNEELTLMIVYGLE